MPEFAPARRERHGIPAGTPHQKSSGGGGVRVLTRDAGLFKQLILPTAAATPAVLWHLRYTWYAVFMSP